jgi:hypothetical protein
VDQACEACTPEQLQQRIRGLQALVAAGMAHREVTTTAHHPDLSAACHQGPLQLIALTVRRAFSLQLARATGIVGQQRSGADEEGISASC